MKRFLQSFYGRLSILFLILLTVMGIVQIWIAFDFSQEFYSETGQKLNYALARDMAPEFETFLKDSINHAGIENMFHYMMVINPKIEIYLLGRDGEILAYFTGPDKKVRTEFVDLAPVESFLEGTMDIPLLGDDPRHPGRLKPFSVAPIEIGGMGDGLLYIILESEQFDYAASTSRDSLVLKTATNALIITLLFTGIIGLILFALLTRRLRAITDVVGQFEAGNFERRIAVASKDELGQLAGTVNKMADEIVKSMMELKRTDDLRRELVANVSHDLRSPLASIKGYLETIQIKDGDLTDEERREYVETILHTATMLEGLVEQLFELSKFDARQTEPHFEPFCVADLVQDIIIKFRPTAEKKSIDLSATVPEQLPLAFADVGLIDRALTNLIENALTYTDAGGSVELQIEADEQQVHVRIVDTGCGIDADDLPFIFDRFYRVEKSRARSTGGAGLGLAITRKILDIHKAEINVTSTLDVGTSFSFELPAWRANKSTRNGSYRNELN